MVAEGPVLDCHLQKVKLDKSRTRGTAPPPGSELSLLPRAGWEDTLHTQHGFPGLACVTICGLPRRWTVDNTFAGELVGLSTAGSTRVSTFRDDLRGLVRARTEEQTRP